MRLVIERGELLRALGHVTSVVERRTTIPILSNVLAAGARFQAASSRRPISNARSSRGVRPTSARRAPSPFRRTCCTTSCASCPTASQVDIRKDGEKERLTLAVRPGALCAADAARRRTSPTSAAGEMGHEFELAAQDLKRLIDKTRFAISTEETRYYLNGIYLHTAQRGKKATLRAVATDGHRLAQVELPLPKGAQGMPGIILPRKTVHELHRLIEDSAGAVKVGVSPGEGALRDRHRDADVEAHRRHLPRLRPRHPAGQRQGDEGLQRRVHGRGRPRVDDRERARARREAQHQAATSWCSRSTTRRAAARPRRSASSTPRARSRSASTRATCSTSPGSSRARRRSFKLADPGSPTMVNDAGDESALYVLMPMRV